MSRQTGQCANRIGCSKTHRVFAACQRHIEVATLRGPMRTSRGRVNTIYAHFLNQIAINTLRQVHFIDIEIVALVVSLQEYKVFPRSPFQRDDLLTPECIRIRAYSSSIIHRIQHYFLNEMEGSRIVEVIHRTDLNRVSIRAGRVRHCTIILFARTRHKAQLQFIEICIHLRHSQQHIIITGGLIEFPCRSTTIRIGIRGSVVFQCRHIVIMAIANIPTILYQDITGCIRFDGIPIGLIIKVVAERNSFQAAGGECYRTCPCRSIPGGAECTSVCAIGGRRVQTIQFYQRRVGMMSHCRCPVHAIHTKHILYRIRSVSALYIQSGGRAGNFIGYRRETYYTIASRLIVIHLDAVQIEIGIRLI